jgi:hypothetical protein
VLYVLQLLDLSLPVIGFSPAEESSRHDIVSAGVGVYLIFHKASTAGVARFVVLTGPVEGFVLALAADLGLQPAIHDAQINHLSIVAGIGAVLPRGRAAPTGYGGTSFD